MKTILIDIDDTLIDSIPRTKAIGELLLDCEISLDDMKNLNLNQVFAKYANDDQKARANELTQQFQDILLCRNSLGIDLMKLNLAIPTAAKVLQLWKNAYQLIYLTGRLEKVRSLTINELKSFGFPIKESNLFMIEKEDQLFKVPLTVTRKEQLTRIFDTIESISIIRVVDDFPGYFPCYKEFSIPERYGFCYGRRDFQDFFKFGATKVFQSWSELIQ
ncbi:MAG: hypothetical protein EAX86_04480 [Candidatus Heimdallarchaeota archaeon]|nr:hypothetical protein [Candidatus Heimdallarchaeota archaeon]